MKQELGFFSGMLYGMAQPSAIDGTKYLDWERAEQICHERQGSTIRAGLAEDWLCTSGLIFCEEKWYNGGILYNQSRWATPILDIDGEEIECWTHKPYNFTGIPEWWGRGEEVLEDDDW